MLPLPRDAVAAQAVLVGAACGIVQDGFRILDNATRIYLIWPTANPGLYSCMRFALARLVTFDGFQVSEMFF